MRPIKASLALVASIGSLLVLTAQGCGSDNGGSADAGPQLATGIYTASDARNVVDNCHTNPTGLAGSQYLVVVDAGFVQFYGTTTAAPVGAEQPEMLASRTHRAALAEPLPAQAGRAWGQRG